MSRVSKIAILAGCLLACPSAWAGEVIVSVTDDAGMPVKDALVQVEREAGGTANNALPAEAVIDQRNEQFVPLVTLIRRGGHVTFANNDVTRHHVYSFSAIKQFQFVLNPGDRSPPIAFDDAGIAAIGCNIHDHMIAYVVASATPWAALSTANGEVRIAGLPNGHAKLLLWHPAMPPGAKASEQAVEIGAAPLKLRLQVKLRMMPMASPHQSHDY